MALKFLNKKGWHTGSLRNIETVWKAEQKHEGEQKKLEELRKQIHDEREKSEFRLMQEQAGLVPKQERLEFLYDSGLQVGKVAQADEYLLGKPVEEAVQPESDVGQVAAKPGALFVEEKPASANDSWRKLHSDPLFLIKQQEQAAIARITSNPVKMAQIKKAAEAKKKLKEEKKKKRKEAKRQRREKRKRKKHHGSSSEDSSDLDDPRKSTKHMHDSDTDGDLKDKRAQVKSRNVSSSPSRSPTRSPVRKDRRQSPRKLRGEEREFEKRKRVPSQSPSRSPVLRDYGRGRSRRDDYDSRGASKQEGRQREHKGSNLRSKEFEGRDSEQRKRAPSRSPSRSASRSPVRRDHDQRLKGSDDQDFEKRKEVASRNPLRGRSRSPVRRSPVRGSPVRSSPVRRDHDQRLKGSDDRDFEKRKRVASRSPVRSRSRSPVRRSPVRRSPVRRSPVRSSPVWGSPVRRSPVRRSPVRRDHDPSRSRRDDFDSRGAFKGEGGRQREQTVHDERLKGPVDRDYEKRKRARSPSRSLSRSPGRRSGYGQSRPRRDDSDSRGEQRYREHNSSHQRLKEPEVQDSRPRDTVESERVFKSSNNGDFRSTESHTKLDAEVQVAGRKDVNGLSSKPGNKGRPPKPGQLSDAERAARLAEMQANADVHEEQRWQRLKRAADADDVEVKRTEKDKSNEQFIADTQKSIFGAEQGKFSTIEKSVKRRAHFMERSSGGDERNAFRR